MTAVHSPLSTRVWSITLVTLVSLLIWVWAAAETRVEPTINIRVRFTPPDPGGWLITTTEDRPISGSLNVELTVRGSKFSAETLEAAARTPFEIPVKPEPREQMFSLKDALAGNRRIEESGVTVVSANPSERTVRIDRVVEVTVPISTKVIGLEEVQTVDGIEIEPPQAAVRLPEQLSAEMVNLELVARLDPPDQKPEPGLMQQLTARLQLPGELQSAADRVVFTTPATGQVKVKLTAQSLRESHTLESVRAQIVADAKNLEEHSVEIAPEDQPLINVTITADRPLIRQIQTGDAKVFAAVQLSSTDFQKESVAKQPTFIAVLLDGSIRTVQGEVAGEVGLPIINLKISPRAPAGNGSS